MPDSLTDAQLFAKEALLEVTPASSIGAFVRETVESDGIVTYRFETTLPGYPGWNWSATISQLPDAEPTIVETELLPDDGALLAPDWVPWSDRMDDYRAAQIALGEAAAELDDADDDSDAEDDDDLDDDDESDDSDDDESDDEDSELDDDDEDDELDDEDVRPVFHGGDLDGVDIDDLDDSIIVIDESDDDSEEVIESDAPLGEGVTEGDESEGQGDDAGGNPPAVRSRRRRAQG